VVVAVLERERELDAAEEGGLGLEHQPVDAGFEASGEMRPSESVAPTPTRSSPR
jgi:hypothetical protein